MAVSSVPQEVHGGGRFALRSREFVPAYLMVHEDGRLREKVDEAISHLGPSCQVCPRLCRGVDRLSGQIGVCRIGRRARVSSASPHFGEEDVLRGWRGSGTIFFSRCNLRCVFCQNFDISQAGEGEEVDARTLAGLMVRLQELGCHNINLVTPEHVVPQIVEALPCAVEMGLRVPLVYNTSAYDSLDSLRVMDGLVDVYMPDFKIWDAKLSRRYLLAPDYPEVARRAFEEMHRQVGVLRSDEEGVALRGTLVRHLVMPGMLDDTRRIFEWLAALSTDTFINVMDQYRPAWKARAEARFSDIQRGVSTHEMADAYRAARDTGLWRFDTRWRETATRQVFLPMAGN